MSATSLFRRLWSVKSQAKAAVAIGCALLLLTNGGDLRADPPDPVMRVEEDWVLVVNTPNSDVTAPQFHTVMSPYADLSSWYMQTLWNYRETPDFTPGGLQVQAWSADRCLAKRSYREESLSTSAETVTWTQRLETNGVALTFKIVNGSSTSWGSFGGDATAVCFPASIANLNSYTTSASVANTWITFGSNRVNSLVIARVRRYGANGLLSEDTTEKVIFKLDP